MTPRLRPAALAALTVVLTASLAACGGSSGSGSAADPTTSAAPSSAAPSSASAAAPSSAAAVAAPSVGGSPTPDAGGAVTFAGVTVGNALTVGSTPAISASNSAPAPGLLVQDLVVGTGPAATSSSTVTVDYSGALYSDGSLFDSSFQRGQPATFSLAQVVAGFAQGIGGTQGVEPMKVGGRRLMIFPAALGYGDRSVSAAIPAGSSLVFVVDLEQLS